MKLNPEIISKFAELGEDIRGMVNKEKIRTCSRCKTHLDKKRIPSQALANNMKLHVPPSQLMDLTQPEIRLVSQVKVYMKMFILSKGRGQKACREIVIHFPQDITEVPDQLKLPLPIADSDMVIVDESVEGVEKSLLISIRPSKVYEALIYLTEHNRLYKNVVIDNTVDLSNLDSIRIRNCDLANEALADEVHLNSDGPLGFTAMKVGHILRGTIHQGHDIFPESNVGLQCTAMAAAFIAHAHVQSPVGWTRETVDQILLKGDRLYSKIRETIESPELTADEVQGIVHNCFGGVDVDLKVDDSNVYYGFFNKANLFNQDNPLKSLDKFICCQETNYAIFTGNGFSMGMFKDDQSFYMFDSHSRGPSGISSSKGTACVVKIPLECAASKLSFIIHRNCQPSAVLKSRNANVVSYTPYQYSITCFRVSIIVPPIEDEDEDTVVENLDDDVVPPPSSPPKSPVKKIARPSVEDFDLEEIPLLDDDLIEVDEPPPAPIEIIQDMNGYENAGDCMIYAADFIEPRADEFEQNAQGMPTMILKRKAGPPLQPHIEKDLD